MFDGIEVLTLLFSCSRCSRCECMGAGLTNQIPRISRHSTVASARGTSHRDDPSHARGLGRQHFERLSRLKMTRQEVRDEHRQSEGNPAVKAWLEQVRSEDSRKPMTAAVSNASVIIANPRTTRSLCPANQARWARLSASPWELSCA